MSAWRGQDKRLADLTDALDEMVICFAAHTHRLLHEHTPTSLVVSYLQMCVRTLERSTNADVLTAMARLSKLAPEVPGNVVVRCLPGIMSVGLKLGPMDPEGNVIKGIVVGALKDGKQVGHRTVVSCSVVL